MSITGKAIKLGHEKVISPCGFSNMAGYKPLHGKNGNDAVLSFMPKTHKVELKIKTLNVGGKEATVTKHIPSPHIPGMWTFFIKYQE